MFPNCKIKVVNSNGAGDAFISGLVYSYLNNYDIDNTIKFAMGCSYMALSHENTINPNINLDSVNEKIKGVGIMLKNYLEISEEVSKH